jgi:hypothetical protein
METYTEEAIRQKLANDERWVRRALIRLYERQTADEKMDERTKVHNKRGFQPTDAKWFSKLAEFVKRNPGKPMSEKQLKIVWKPWRNEPAICKYAGQIMKIIQEDVEAKMAKSAVVSAQRKRFSDCEICGEELPTCRCAYKIAYANYELQMEQRAFLSKLDR